MTVDALMAVSISVGIFSGLWAYLSSAFGLITWAGFLGCTTYFAAGGKKEGFKKAIITNIAGVFWAVITIICSNKLGFSGAGALMTGIASFIMCAQAKWSLLDFIPGTFVGSCTTFAAQGDWKQAIPALICGAILGYVSESVGIWLYDILNQKEIGEKATQ